MLNLYLYETATGRVLATGAYNEVGDGASAGRTLVVGQINPLTEYAPAGVKTLRPLFTNLLLDKLVILANSTDAATISNIPTGTVVKVVKDQDVIPCAVMTVNDGTVVLRVDTPGSYTILLMNFPTKEAVFKVTAT